MLRKYFEKNHQFDWSRVGDSCSSNAPARLVAPAGFECELRRCFLLNCIMWLCKSFLFKNLQLFSSFFSFFFFFLLFLSFLACRRCNALSQFLIVVWEKQTFGPSRSSLHVTSWCSQGCCSNSRLSPDLLWPWNQRCSVRAAPLRQCVFYSKCSQTVLAALIEAIQ